MLIFALVAFILVIILSSYLVASLVLERRPWRRLPRWRRPPRDGDDGNR